MATTYKRRLRRFNGDDYDTIYLETSSTIVKMVSGATVEDSVNSKMPTNIPDDTIANTYYKLGFDNGALYVEDVTI